MRSWLLVVFLIVVLGLVFLLYMGRKKEEGAPVNISAQRMNVPVAKGAPSTPSMSKAEKTKVKMGDLVDLNKDNFAQFIQSAGPVVVDFWATTCTACRLLEPVLREIASEMKGKMRFAKLAIDMGENYSIAERFAIRATPTLIVFKNGKELGRLMGYMGKEELRNALENFLKNPILEKRR